MKEIKKATMHYHYVESRVKGENGKKKYVAKTSHFKVCEWEDYAYEIEKQCSVKKSDMDAVMGEIGEYLLEHLRRGDIVRIPNIGEFKLEAECVPVDDIEKGSTPTVRRFQLHVIPESFRKRQSLYNNIVLKKDK